MLYYKTINQTLFDSLKILMSCSELKDFRLVGGTALSLQVGHRISIDIDLFSDKEYGKIDFYQIDSFLEKSFPFVEHYSILPALGKSYRIGKSAKEYVKLDIFYTDNFIENSMIIDDIRMVSIKDIVAMKVDVVQRIGRKKDFWDLHKLLEFFTISKMIEFHQQRYPYTHDRELIISNFTNFELADEEPDPNCLEGKYWELIKLDFEEEIRKLIL